MSYCCNREDILGHKNKAKYLDVKSLNIQMLKPCITKEKVRERQDEKIDGGRGVLDK